MKAFLRWARSRWLPKPRQVRSPLETDIGVLALAASIVEIRAIVSTGRDLSQADRYNIRDAAENSVRDFVRLEHGDFEQAKTKFLESRRITEADIMGSGVVLWELTGKEGSLDLSKTKR